MSTFLQKTTDLSFIHVMEMNKYSNKKASNEQEMIKTWLYYDILVPTEIYLKIFSSNLF